MDIIPSDRSILTLYKVAVTLDEASRERGSTRKGLTRYYFVFSLVKRAGVTRSCRQPRQASQASSAEVTEQNSSGLARNFLVY